MTRRDSDTAARAPWAAILLDGWEWMMEHAPRPLPMDAVISDLRWWQSRVVAPGSRVRLPGYRDLAKRWGWTDHAARTMLADELVWRDPGLTGERLARWQSARRAVVAQRSRTDRAECAQDSRALCVIVGVDPSVDAQPSRTCRAEHAQPSRTDRDTRVVDTDHQAQVTEHKSPSADQQQQPTSEPEHAAPVRPLLTVPPGSASDSSLTALTARPEPVEASTPAPLALTAPEGKQRASRKAPATDGLTLSPVAEAVLAAWASNPNRGTPTKPETVKPGTSTARAIDDAARKLGAEKLIRRIQAAVRDPWIRGLDKPMKLAQLLWESNKLITRLDMEADEAEIAPTPEGWRTDAVATGPAGSPWEAMLAREERLRRPRSGGHPWLHEGGTGWRWPDADEHEKFRRAFLAAGGWPVWCEADERGQQRFKAAFDAAWSQA